VDRAQPDPATVQELQDYLDTTPGLWQALGDLARLTRDSALGRLTSHAPLSARLSLEKGAEVIRDAMGYGQAPQLERLLIDHALLCWYRLQIAEFQYSAAGDDPLTLARAAWQEKHLDAVQRRYLRACETLSRVRKLARQSPALQVNVALEGGRQLNVAGSVAAAPPAFDG